MKLSFILQIVNIIEFIKSNAPFFTSIALLFAVVNLILTFLRSKKNKNLVEQVRIGVDSLRYTYFDDVTYGIFQKIKMNGKLEKRMRDDFKEEKVYLAKNLNYTENAPSKNENKSIMEYFVNKTIELDYQIT